MLTGTLDESLRHRLHTDGTVVSTHREPTNRNTIKNSSSARSLTEHATVLATDPLATSVMVEAQRDCVVVPATHPPSAMVGAPWLRTRPPRRSDAANGKAAKSPVFGRTHARAAHAYMVNQMAVERLVTVRHTELER
jgi:hypothetical protein